MARKDSKPESPLLGRRHCVSRSTWDESHFNEEVQAFIEFREGTLGEFQFGYVRGDIDYREAQSDGQPAVEWTWEGSDGADGRPLTGRGWAKMKDEGVYGLVVIHMGDESEFEAMQAVGTRRPKRS